MLYEVPMTVPIMSDVNKETFSNRSHLIDLKVIFNVFFDFIL